MLLKHAQKMHDKHSKTSCFSGLKHLKRQNTECACRTGLNKEHACMLYPDSDYLGGRDSAG